MSSGALNLPGASEPLGMVLSMQIPRPTLQDSVSRSDMGPGNLLVFTKLWL